MIDPFDLSPRLWRSIRTNVLCIAGVALAAALVLPVWSCRPCRGSGLVMKMTQPCGSCEAKGRLGFAPWFRQLFR